MGPLSQKLWTPSPSMDPHLFLLVLLNRWLGITRKLVNGRFLGYLLRDSNKEIHVGAALLASTQVIRGRWATEHAQCIPNPTPFAASNHPTFSRPGLSSYPPPLITPAQDDLICHSSLIIKHHLLSFCVQFLCISGP